MYSTEYDESSIELSDFSERHIAEIPFVVIDVETTGSDSKKNRITEIACVVVQDGAIVDTYSSLVKAGQFVPPMITRVTGITNEMLVSAPYPSEVLKKVLTILLKKDAVFTAHNVNFDYGFVIQSLLREELPQVNIPRLCTYRMAKRMFPKNSKLNVGALAQYLGISVEHRHRALGDAMATAQSLIEMLEIAEHEHGITTIGELLHFQNRPLQAFKSIPKNIKNLQSTLAQLPDEPGVYYMRDEDNVILYIGKAKSLLGRVNSYFRPSATLSSKISEMVKRVRSVTWQCTDTELSALLLESREIKFHKPKYNSLIKRFGKYPFLRIGSPSEGTDDFPILDWRYEISDDGAEYFGPFNGRSSVESIIETINRAFKLRECKEVLRPDLNFTPCFYHQIQRCHAPCAGKQSPEEYQHEVENVRKFLSGERDGIIAVLKNYMAESSDRHDFEEAAALRNRIQELERVFFRQQRISTSVNSNNLIILIPASSNPKKVEVFFIRFGRLVYQRLVGIKVPMKELEQELEIHFNNGLIAPKICHKTEIDEIRIIANWIHQNKSIGTFIYTDNVNKAELLLDLSKKILKIISKRTRT